MTRTTRMTWTKKYLPAATAVVAAAAAVAAPTVASAETAPAAASAPAAVAPAAPAAAETTPAPAPAPVRTVRPGERVDAGEGWTVWLTRQGKHWSGPDGYENFRSVVDGNIDRSQPGVSHQSEGDANGVFHSGLYYGTRDAGRVELTGADGRKTVATLVALPGRSDWGVWYVHTGPSQGSPAVALYDRGGKLLTELPASEF
ncbi:hypothetical protein OG361_18075 [Streptomyces sp. NBC_00090]|uniref:hypothetical protein n=1 Tax=Streptomyces sp. NBC_00090 TaxID=2903619 RepID=UPI00324ADB68